MLKVLVTRVQSSGGKFQQPFVSLNVVGLLFHFCFFFVFKIKEISDEIPTTCEARKPPFAVLKTKVATSIVLISSLSEGVCVLQNMG